MYKCHKLDFVLDFITTLNKKKYEAQYCFPLTSFELVCNIEGEGVHWV